MKKLVEVVESSRSKEKDEEMTVTRSKKQTKVQLAVSVVLQLEDLMDRLDALTHVMVGDAADFGYDHQDRNERLRACLDRLGSCLGSVCQFYSHPLYNDNLQEAVGPAHSGEAQ